MEVGDLSLSNQEWHEVIKTWPLALAKVPKAMRCDTLYVEALCASDGSAEVLALLPTENQEYKESLCTRAFQKNPALIGLLAVEKRTPEICKEACIDRPQAMAHVPKGIQTEEFLQQLCAKNPDCFCELSDDQKTKSLALVVCAKKGTLLKEVPLERRDQELCEIACLADAAAISLVSEDLCTEAFCQKLVDHSYRNLEYIPTDKITPGMCESACDQSPEALELVPGELKTEVLYHKALGHSRRHMAYPYVPLHLVPADECRQLCEEDGRNLINVPDALKNEELARIASKHECWDLCDILEKDRTRELCLKHGVAESCDFSSVPGGHIDLAFLFSVKGGKDDLELHVRAQKLLTKEDYTTFLCISALYRTQTQIKLLTWPALPDYFRRRLIDFLAGQGDPISLQNLPQHALINPHNPLRSALYNPLVSKLLRQAHSASHYRPACQADGQAWLHYLEEQLPRYTDRPLPLIDDELSAPLKTSHIEKKGGRTLQVKKGDTIYYYKFQRQDEPLADLVREGLIHQFRAGNPQGAWAKLASDLPKDPHFFALPQSLWPSQKEKFKDEVKVHKAPGREPWVNVYRYTASADYGRYAHQPDSEADCPWTKPEQAILTACYDMGLFASMGLMLTSMLPAMHNSTAGRSWQALYDLFGNRSSVETHPGTLGAWNGTATEHCDIGFNGLRDVGDYEQFGAIRSCFDKSDNDGSAQPVETGQRLAVVSTLCDNVMAAVLVRSRLRQHDANYHYKKSEALAATARFIGDVCDCLLTGLAGKGKEEVQTGICAKIMRIKGVKYDQWLWRAALEIVYWTARQPGMNSAQRAIFGQTKNSPDPLDGWVFHLTKENKLSSTLYDPADFQPYAYHNSGPDWFVNPNQEDNLGAHSEAFPMATLVQGLTSLGGDILEKWSQPPSPEANDTAMASD